jgi:hypothetical protein
MAEAEWRPITAVAEATGEVLGKMRADLRAEFEAELAKIRIEGWKCRHWVFSIWTTSSIEAAAFIAIVALMVAAIISYSCDAITRQIIA